MQIKHERPEWVKNFKCEKNTEIKYINGHWYLYERSTKYDPELKRSRKVSGRLLGSITEDGFVPKRERGKAKSDPVTAPLEVKTQKAEVEKNAYVPPVAPIPLKTPEPVIKDMSLAGSYMVLGKHISALESKLEEHFPLIWKELLVLSMLRLESRDSRFFEERYLSSMLSRVYPGLDFSFLSLRRLSDVFSQNGDDVTSFFRDMAYGYDAKAACALDFRGYSIAPIINMNDNSSDIVSYVPLPSGDVSSLLEQLLDKKCGDILVTARKDELEKEDLKKLYSSGLDYVLRLKRDGKTAISVVPALDELYDDSFDAEGRCVLYSTISFNDYDIHVYKDVERRNEDVRSRRRKRTFIADGISIYKTNRKGMNARCLYDMVLEKDRIDNFIASFMEEKEELPPVFGLNLSLFIERIAVYLAQFLIRKEKDLNLGVEEILELSKMSFAYLSGGIWKYKVVGKAENLTD